MNFLFHYSLLLFKDNISNDIFKITIVHFWISLFKFKQCTCFLYAGCLFNVNLNSAPVFLYTGCLFNINLNDAPVYI